MCYFLRGENARGLAGIKGVCQDVVILNQRLEIKVKLSSKSNLKTLFNGILMVHIIPIISFFFFKGHGHLPCSSINSSSVLQKSGLSLSLVDSDQVPQRCLAACDNTVIVATVSKPVHIFS